MLAKSTLRTTGHSLNVIRIESEGLWKGHSPALRLGLAHPGLRAESHGDKGAEQNSRDGTVPDEAGRITTFP